MTDEEEFSARSQLKGTREGDAWILLYRRRRMGRVVPRPAICTSFKLRVWRGGRRGNSGLARQDPHQMEMRPLAVPFGHRHHPKTASRRQPSWHRLWPIAPRQNARTVGQHD